MKHRTVAVVTILLVTATAVFVFAPLVYSPIKIIYRGGDWGQRRPSIWAYESPSCAVFGMGTELRVALGPGSYYIGCPPKEVYTKPNANSSSL